MLRVTVELVPYGMEALAKTISEVCIANVGGDDKAAEYEAAGYVVNQQNQIQEFAVALKNFDREHGALELVKQVLEADRSEFAEVKLAEGLLNKTRLLSPTQEEQE